MIRTIHLSHNIGQFDVTLPSKAFSLLAQCKALLHLTLTFDVHELKCFHSNRAESMARKYYGFSLPGTQGRERYHSGYNVPYVLLDKMCVLIVPVSDNL